MLTHTSELGIQALLYLALQGDGEMIPPRRIAAAIDASPSYMSKVTGLLVRAGILAAHKGARGGVMLSVKPAELSLLEIVEACQGKVLGDFCEPTSKLDQVCAYHRSMAELHDAIIDVLSRWTLADLVAKPLPSPSLAPHVKCKIRLNSRPSGPEI